MRVVIALAVLVLAGCDVQNDPTNDEVTVRYDEQRIKKAASDTERVAKDVATSAGNIAAGTAKAIKKEVGDVDVDVKVSRDRTEPDQTPRPE